MIAPEKIRQLLEDYRRLSEAAKRGPLSPPDRQALELVKDVLLEEGALLEAQETRQIPRVPRAPLSMEVQFPSQGSVAKALTKDVSTGGLALATDRPLPVGSVLNLTVKVPGWPEPLSVKGQVMWVKAGTMGISFQELGPKDQQRLKDLVLENTSVLSKLTSALGHKEKQASAQVSGWACVVLRLGDEVMADVTAELLGAHGYLVHEDPPPEVHPGLVVGDLRTASALVHRFKGIPLVLVNVSGPEALVGDMATLRPRGYVQRPASPARIVEAVRKAVQLQGTTTAG